VPARTITQQLRWLLRVGYRGVTAEAVLGNASRVVHVTFDDAFRNVTRVLPALERLAVPVTVFACTAYAEQGLKLDVPELRQRGARAPDELATLDWDGLRDLAEGGVEIGSHTRSHPHLPRLTDGELRRELNESKERLEGELRRPCRFVAYPYGEDDARVRAAARAAGYEAAFTLRIPRGPVDSFAIPRVGIYRGDAAARFVVKAELLRGPLGSLPDRLRERRPRYGIGGE
jgi:peptidoglycan/xylan/chitin deacetylase (PgdA/CDA1 family)